MADNMELLDATDVCKMLGISKSTLYRWCDVSEPVSDMRTMDRPRGIILGLRQGYTYETNNNQKPNGFPRPFKIGKSHKWDKQELISWVRSNRI